MVRLSVNELTTMRWSFEEDVLEYAHAGFQGIGVWRQKLSDVSIEWAVELLQRHDLQCSNLMWAGGFTGSDGCSFRDSVLDAVEAIKTAARLDCPCLVVYSGAWGGHTRKHAKRLFKNALGQIVPFAEEFGVQLALEPMHPGCGGDWTFLESVDDTLGLIDPFDSPMLKLALDTYHFGIQDPDFSLLRQVASRIAIVHLGDGVDLPAGEQDRCRLGDGVVPLVEIMDTLLACDYDGFFDVELMGESVERIDYPTLLADAREFLASASLA